MSLANSYCDYNQDARPRSGIHVDSAFPRHFVGVFALAFSLAAWFAALRFGLHVL